MLGIFLGISVVVTGGISQFPYCGKFSDTHLPLRFWDIPGISHFPKKRNIQPWVSICLYDIDNVTDIFVYIACIYNMHHIDRKINFIYSEYPNCAYYRDDKL